MAEKILRFFLYQPTANYRPPWGFVIRATYPLPPHSTIIGFLANLYGLNYYSPQEEKQKFEKAVKNIHVQVFTTFKRKIADYAWLRNTAGKKLSKGDLDRWKENFAVVDSPGKQQPIRVETLLDVYHIVYVKFEDNAVEIADKILENLKEGKCGDILHLGRAEDLVVILEVKELRNLKKGSNSNFSNFMTFVPEDVETESEGPSRFITMPLYYERKISGRRIFKTQTGYIVGNSMIGIEPSVPMDVIKAERINSLLGIGELKCPLFF